MPVPDPTARPAVQQLRPSRIREVANAAMGREDVSAFWFGEPDEMTPDFIRHAAVESLNRGETFYSQNLGLIELREALAAYVSRLHRPTSADEIAVTSSGLSALQLASQALVGHGDRVVEVTPLWPNLVEIPKILGAQVECVALRLHAGGLEARSRPPAGGTDPDTRALLHQFAQQPDRLDHRPSGSEAILAHCRRHGIWLITDDAYERLYYGGPSDGKVGALFLRHRAAAGSAARRQHVFQIVVNDRVPPGLDRRLPPH